MVFWLACAVYYEYSGRAYLRGTYVSLFYYINLKFLKKYDILYIENEKGALIYD